MDGASGAGTPELDVRLLGPCEAVRVGASVALGGAKPRTLLAVLALEPGRVVSVDRLVEALWPGDPPETSSHAIQVYVSQLRKALGPVIATQAPGYVLELPAERIDVHRFTRLAHEGRGALEGGDPVAAEGALREALALWRGPALADFLYEPFAQTDIARLEELRTVVLEERIDADLALGRHAELVPELEALVQAQPLRERPRAQLMLALYRSGRQADALAAYRAARETLVEELGIDPGPELRVLEAAILRQDESLLLGEGPPTRPAMQFRRLVTILFVDIVESMALAEELDPEALGQVLRSYFETVSAALTRHGGTVEKYAGDAVMAAFGIPIAHEDDALRAARAALDIRVGIAALNEQLVRQHGVGLEIRTGIEAGEVVATPADARQRLVTGEAVGIASKLEASAGADDIVVGEAAARLIDHAARLEPLGDVDIKGLSRPVSAFRLVELEPAAPAFARRLDAPLVGRKRELAALRRSLKRAVDSGSARVSVVVAPPGVGKSRLAAEFARRAKGVTALWGRCLSYGDGISYWPLREALAGAGESAERDAVLAALDADTPPPALEIAFLFRQLCEALARERPLVLVVDDVHWAEPTLLELIEHLADRGEAPIHVVCLAREELADTRPSFLEGHTNVDRIELDLLSGEETEALVDALGGTILETDQRRRLVETGEGNPLFLEQLLALALEGGLGVERPPETIQALLAARLDGLGPGERAVLERGSVVGKEFSEEDVVALLEPDAACTVGSHLETLAARGFVRPDRDGVFAFRHVLVQDAVYRAAPKRLRAELHERYADRLDETSPDLAELDEFVGYHLEKAYRLRTELGESDRRTERLAEDGGRRLRTAGFRSSRRGDVPATIGLFERAVGLESDEHVRRELSLHLGVAYYAARRTDEAIELLSMLSDESRAAGDELIEARARLELEFIRVRHQGRTADELLKCAESAIPIFERHGDHRAQGRAWLFAGWVLGGHRAQYAAWVAAAEQALEHYRQAGWSIATCVGEVAAGLYWGPAPVRAAIERCKQLLEEESSDRLAVGYLESFLGGLVAQAGDIEAGRLRAQDGLRILDELGVGQSALAYSRTLLGEIELLAGDAMAAERVLRSLCADLERVGEVSQLASRASDLAEALVLMGGLDEADAWTTLAQRRAAPDDVNAQMMWRPVRARILARRGMTRDAERLAREGIRLAETTDDLNRRGEAWRDLAEVLRLAGRVTEAEDALTRAMHLFGQKGNRAALRDARRGHQQLAPA